VEFVQITHVGHEAGQIWVREKEKMVPSSVYSRDQRSNHHHDDSSLVVIAWSDRERVGCGDTF
jgi:hypothetical protein